MHTDDSRRIDWSKVKGDPAKTMRRQILRFIYGIRGPRKNEVTKKQILAWFHGTPEEFDLLTDDEINVCRTSLSDRANRKYVYELTDKGRATLGVP